MRAIRLFLKTFRRAGGPRWCPDWSRNPSAGPWPYCSLCPPAAFALGLGDIHLLSSLNAPSQAREIELVGATREDLGSLHAAVANHDTFSRYGLDGRRLGGISMHPEHTAERARRHQSLLARGHHRTLRHTPVEVTWARGQLVRGVQPFFWIRRSIRPGQSESSAAPVAASRGRHGHARRIDQPRACSRAPAASAAASGESAPSAAPAAPAPAQVRVRVRVRRAVSPGRASCSAAIRSRRLPDRFQRAAARAPAAGWSSFIRPIRAPSKAI